MATITLERPKPNVFNPDFCNREWPNPAEFRAASRGNEDLALLFDAVDVEDARRAHEARRLALVHQAVDLNTDIASIRDAILEDAEVELRVWADNLTATLNATGERMSDMIAEIRDTGFAEGELRSLFESLTSGHTLARQLLNRVAGPDAV